MINSTGYELKGQSRYMRMNPQVYNKLFFYKLLSQSKTIKQPGLFQISPKGNCARVGPSEPCDPRKPRPPGWSRAGGIGCGRKDSVSR